MKRRQLLTTTVTGQGIIDCKGKETQRIFSRVCNSKKIKELFASTSNGIAASVRCVSFMIVVLNTKLTRLIAAHANKKHSEKQKVRSAVFFC